jgi:hypothetical protein
MGYDDFLSPPPRWIRIAPNYATGRRKHAADADMAGMIGLEMRHVFSVAKTTPEPEGVRRLLEQIERKRKQRR